MVLSAPPHASGQPVVRAHHGTFVPFWGPGVADNALPVHTAAMTAHHRNATTIALLAALCGCTLNADVDVGLPEQRGEESSGSTGEPAQGVTGEQGSGAMSDDGATGGESTGATGGGESGGTTGETPDQCVLPHDPAQSWCAAQRLVAQAIDCRTPDGLVPECYQTIVAQYTEGVWELVQAGDCSTAIDGPECEEPYMACTNASGPNDCTLGSVDSLEVCLTNAEAAGLSSEAALPWCQRMIALWVDGCTTTLLGEPCETSCAFPCSHGMACTGEPGAEVCT